MDALLKAVRAAHPAADIELVERAYTVAAYTHRGQTRKSGDPYISHPIAVAMIVTELGMASEVVCAALLHDTVDCDATHMCTLAQLREEFGEKIAALVDGVSELDKLGHGHAEERLRHVEATLKLNTNSAPMSQSPEAMVLILKLADRLHNMRTMCYVAPDTQQVKSRETLRVHAPLAGLLGMGSIQRELEYLASAIVYSTFDYEHPRTVSERALGAAVVLLPSAMRARWLQEWAGELCVLPTRRARARFALQMLRGVPRLAVVLRQGTARGGALG
ncbi:MAG: HD domain-containing protein [Actinomycetota bacterium]|nr:HD domain-containing protein [Actinomycetota bacterium]